MKDFFISYNKADKLWASWIAWTLERSGCTVTIQDWDFRPGDNFVVAMQTALQDTRKTVIVLSEDFLNSGFTAAEWTAVFATDPDARNKRLVPVRVRHCKPQGLLQALVYVDLVGLPEEHARAALLGAFSERAKPLECPPFPGEESPTANGCGKLSDEPSPEVSVSGQTQVAVDQRRRERLSTAERIDLNSRLNGIPPALFNMVLFALGPPQGLIAPMPAPQAERASQLLQWAESTMGPGVSAVAEALSNTSDQRTSMNRDGMKIPADGYKASLPVISTEELISRETRKGDGEGCLEAGSVVVVHVQQTTEQINPALAEKVVDNLYEGICYWYFFDSDHIGMIPGLIQALWAAKFSKCPDDCKQSSNPVLQRSLDVMSKYLAIYIVGCQWPFEFCIHNAQDMNHANCYLRLPRTDCLAEWCEGKDAFEIAEKLRREVMPLSGGSGCIRLTRSFPPQSGRLARWQETKKYLWREIQRAFPFRANREARTRLKHVCFGHS